MKARTVFRLAEGLLIFVMVPLLFYFNWVPIPKIAALLLVTAICTGLLAADDTYELNKLMYRPDIPGMWKKLLVKTGLVAVAVFILTIIVQPEALLLLPRERPVIWVIILLLYPVLSALPQELVYRAFFFQRYGEFIYPEWLLVAASASSFSFLHIVYDNEWALLLSLIGGFMFAKTYKETRSLYWVSVEHALYGCVVFTIGLGSFFYEPF